MKHSIWIGYDPREANAFALARYSTKKHLTQPIPVHGLVLSDLRKRGIYSRPHEQRGLQMWDVVSDAPMSTQFACSRFLVPFLAGEGFAMFYDCDMLVRTNLVRFFEEIMKPEFAVMCVKHNHVPDYSEKMDHQMQTLYARKNWSSVMCFNCDHPSNKWLTVKNVNAVPGRDLHRFCWLEDDEIGELGPEWNYLVGHTKLPKGVEPNIVHHTDGIPSMPGYEDTEYADEWRTQLDQWAA